MRFNDWLDLLIEEKELDLSEHIEVLREDASAGYVMGSMPLGFIVEHIKALGSEKDKADIKNVLVKIDFHNGDVCHFFSHLGRALWEEYGVYLAVV